MSLSTGRSAGAAIVAAALLAAGPAAAQKSGGILKLYATDNPPSASVLEESTIVTLMPYMAVYNNLVMFDPDVKQQSMESIVPDLAKSWSWSEDNKTLSFKLHTGVTWHDGKPFSAKDVKCTWDSMMGKGESRLRKNPREAWYTNVEEVSVDADDAVSFHLKRPQPSFINLLAAGFSGINPCHVSARDMRQHPIGTGPFRFVEYRQNSHIKLEKNPNYWKEGLPYLDGIEYTIVRNRSTRILGFVSKEYDMTFNHDVTLPLLKDVESQVPDAFCQVSPPGTQITLMLNRDVEPFDNENVRRAIQLAIDRKAYTDILTQGKARPGGTMLPQPEGLWGMPTEMLEKITGYDPDIEKSRTEARKIMEEHGYTEQNPLRVKLASRDLPSYRDPAVILIDHLRAINVAAELELVDSTMWYNRMTRKDYAIALNNTGLALDEPDVNFFENYACDSQRNYTRYCNKDVEAMFVEQSSMIDQEKRKELVWEIDRRLQEEGARPVIFHNISATCAHPYVKGLSMATNSQYSHWRFETVWLDK